MNSQLLHLQLCLFIYINSFYVILAEKKSTYKAVVVEYHTFIDSKLKPEDILSRNVNNYLHILQNNISKPTDIVVFPEATLDDSLFSLANIKLYTTVPSANEQISPCKEHKYPKFFKDLSCAAKNNSLYLVINLVEKEPCSPSKDNCAKYGYNLYNTDVVFNRKGTVVARYRKFHLFGEHLKNTTARPENVTFTTDFGVTFGIFTCFDILFEKPSLDLIRNGIKHIIFPTLWFSELPFLTALQTQQMWAQSNNVNFLAANGNDPRVGSGGSGLYQGINGPVIFNITSRNTSTIMESKMFKKIKNKKGSILLTDDTDALAKEMDSFSFFKDDLKDYTFEPVKKISSESFYRICNNNDNRYELCCYFDVKISVDQSEFRKDRDQYTYLMVVYSGKRTFARLMNAGVENCAIVACLNDSPQSCSGRFPVYTNITWPTQFEYIKVEANFTITDSKHQYPNSLLSSIRPIPPSSTEWSSQLYLDEKVIQRTHILKSQQNRLFTFGIFGRDFGRDRLVPGRKNALQELLKNSEK